MASSLVQSFSSISKTILMASSGCGPPLMLDVFLPCQPHSRAMQGTVRKHLAHLQALLDNLACLTRSNLRSQFPESSALRIFEVDNIENVGINQTLPTLDREKCSSTSKHICHASTGFVWTTSAVSSRYTCMPCS
jgi:hypothetical protein